MSEQPGSLGTARDELDVLKAHGFHNLTVKQVVEETSDARSFVLDVPSGMSELFRYEPGQFCTFRVRIEGTEYLRSYSMSSAPETDRDLTVTVKRVGGGVVSNWLMDNVSPGDSLEATKPSGVFCLHDRDTPVIAFCGGSGVTPVMSIAKRLMASTSRTMKVVYANRSPESVIFAALLEEMRAAHPERMEVDFHFDSEAGFLTETDVDGHLGDHLAADFYVCGPGPFMDLVETTLVGRGVPEGNIFIERFGLDLAAATEPSNQARPESAATPETITIIMRGRKTRIAYQPGDTILETARRGALKPPFSCESGNCATCMAILRGGSATMRLNNALTPEEVDEGWILTCQALPTGADVVVEYEAM